MKEERMKVLQMLEEGKIDANEAERLLELFTKNVKSDKTREMVDDINEKTSAFNEKVNAAVKEFVEKIDKLTKDVEPKIKKAAQIVVENTVATVDGLSKTFNETSEETDETEKSDEDCCCGCCEDEKENKEN